MLQIFKNVASQKVYVYAYTPADGLPKTGDSANITAYIAKDFGSATALTDTSATEVDATNAPGYYVFDISQTETNADVILVTGKSSTSGVKVLGAPAMIGTRPTTGFLAPATAGRTLVVDASGLADANTVKIGPSGSGTAQTARDIGASVLISSGTGAGQLDVTSGRIKADTVYFGGVAGTFSGGRPETNTTHLAGTAYASADFSTTMKASINTEADTALADVGVTTTVTGRIDVAVSTRLASASYTAPLDAAGTRTAVGLASANLDTQLSGINSKTTNLPSDPADASDIATAFAAVPAAVWSYGTRTLSSFGTLVSDIWTAFNATQFAKFFTVNSTKTYADAVAGSVVKEIADNASGGGGGSTVALIIGGWTKDGTTYHVSFALIVNGVLKTSGLSAPTVTFRDEDGTDLTFGGTPAVGTGGIVNASGSLGTAITDNTPVMVIVGVTYNAVDYTAVLPGAALS